MHRLFVAVDLPDDVRSSLAGVCRPIPGAKWVPPEQLHLTLRFIGDADDSTFAAIRNALAGVHGVSFPLAVRGVGHFPPGKHPRVMWVGLEPCEPLLALQQEIETAVVAAGIPPDPRRFSPHITIARLKEAQLARGDEFEAACRTLAYEPFPIAEFHLYSSTLSSKGAIHRRERSYPLDNP